MRGKTRCLYYRNSQMQECYYRDFTLARQAITHIIGRRSRTLASKKNTELYSLEWGDWAGLDNFCRKYNYDDEARCVDIVLYDPNQTGGYDLERRQ